MTAVPRDAAVAWRLTAALAAVHVSSSIDRHVVSLLLTPLKAEFGLSDTLLGLLHGTAYTLLYAIAIIPCGMLVDRVDRRALVAAAVLLWSVGTAAFALAETFAGLFAARLLVGLGQAALVPAAIGLIADGFAGSQLGRPIGLFTSAAAFGRAAALIGGGALLAWLGGASPGGADAAWREMLLLSLVVNAAVLAFLLTTRAPPRRRRDAAEQGAVLGWLVVHRRATAAILAGATSTILLIQSVSAWTPALFVRRFALSTAESGLLAGGIVLVAGPLGNLAGGAILDRLERAGVADPARRVLAAALVCAGLTAPLVGLAPRLGLTVAGLTLAAFFLGVATPAGLAGLHRITPEALRGRVTAGFVSSVSLLSLGIGPLLVGWLSETLFSGPHSLSLALSLLMAIVAAFGALATWPWVRPR